MDGDSRRKAWAMSETEHDTDATDAAPSSTAAAKADERQALWNELPDPVTPEETETSKDTTPPAPDLVADPDHEFMIRHAG